MMNEPRTNSLWRRNDQLTNWNRSEMATVSERYHLPDKVQFEKNCVFLACCASSDFDEIQQLLRNGADINATNTDGLTALHQACIDNNSNLVEFLIDNGANVNAADNEGWTPLHATSSQGYTEIARILLKHGADIGVVNCDNELAFDLSDVDELDDLFEEQMHKIDMDVENAREVERFLMLQDVNRSLETGIFIDKIDPQTGATSLHVASSKGYIDVLHLLLKAGADVTAIDYDGWTPAHAAAHWEQKEALNILAMEGLCDLEALNYHSQTPGDVCEGKMRVYWEELKTRQQLKSAAENLKIESMKDRLIDKQQRRTSITRLTINQKENIKKGSNKEECEILMRSTPPVTVKTDEPSDKVRKIDKENINDQSTIITPSTTISTPLSNIVTASQKTNDKVNDGDKVDQITDLPTIKPLSLRPPLRKTESLPETLKIDQGTKNTTTTETITSTTTVRSLSNSDVDDQKSKDQWNNMMFGGHSKFGLSALRGANAKLYIPESQNFENNRQQPSSTTVVSTSSTTTTTSDDIENNSSDESIKNGVVKSVIDNEGKNTGREILDYKSIFRRKFLEDGGGDLCETGSSGSNSAISTKRVSLVPPISDEAETLRKAKARQARKTRRSTQGVKAEDVKNAEKLLEVASVNGKSDKTTNSKPITTESSINYEEKTTVTTLPTTTTNLTISTTNVTIVPTTLAKEKEEQSENSKKKSQDSVDNQSISKISASTGTIPSNTKTFGLASNSFFSATAGATTTNTHTTNTDSNSISRSISNSSSSIPTCTVTKTTITPSTTITTTPHLTTTEDRLQRRRARHQQFLNESSTQNSSGKCESCDKLKEETVKLKKDLEESKINNRKLSTDFENMKIEYDKYKRTSANFYEASERKEKRFLERQLAELQTEINQMADLKKELQKCKEENSALIRVISKLSKNDQSQTSNVTATHHHHHGTRL